MNNRSQSLVLAEKVTPVKLIAPPVLLFLKTWIIELPALQALFPVWYRHLYRQWKDRRVYLAGRVVDLCIEGYSAGSRTAVAEDRKRFACGIGNGNIGFVISIQVVYLYMNGACTCSRKLRLKK